MGSGCPAVTLACCPCAVGVASATSSPGQLGDMASRAGSSLLGVHSSLPLGLHRAHGDLATWVTSWMLAHRSPRTPGTPRPRSAQDRLARTRTFQDELLGPSQRAFRNRTRVHTLLPCRSHKHVCAKGSLRREGRRPRLNKQENRWGGDQNMQHTPDSCLCAGPVAAPGPGSAHWSG